MQFFNCYLRATCLAAGGVAHRAAAAAAAKERCSIVRGWGNRSKNGMDFTYFARNGGGLRQLGYVARRRVSDLIYPFIFLSATRLN
jgi:hypothetical protein